MTTHPHGDARRYRYSKCRCDKCRAANAREMNLYRMRVASGQHRPDVDAEPVRRHVQRLRREGLGVQRIAQLAGVSGQVLQALLYGHPSLGLPPSRKMRAANADKILAVHAGRKPGRGWILATGTRRRMQALAAVGWPLSWLEKESGLPGGHGHRLAHAGDEQRVTVQTAQAVAAVYDRLWNADPLEAGVPAAASTRIRNVAARRGWLPPLAWDDLIDLTGDDLEAELRRRVERMDDDEIAACHYAHRRHGDQSPLMVAAAREYDRRRVGRHRRKEPAA